jgi:uroporphyrinogen decarboxylase
MAKPTLSSRERVLRTINHQEPDRVPFNAVFTIDIYNRLREYLNLPAETEKAVGLFTNVTSSIDLLDAMEIDIYRSELNAPANWKPPDYNNGLRYDEWNIGYEKVEREDGSYYFEMVKHPLAKATLEEVQDFPWPDPFDPGRTEGLREHIQQIRKETDKAILMRFSHPVWEQSWWLYGMQNWMEDLALNPEVPAAILDKVTQSAIGFMKVGLECVGDLLDIVHLNGEDLGTQLAPMISPKMYKSLVRPRFERYWSFARNKVNEINPQAKLMLHSCGSIRAFIPDWIGLGIDILDPIQPRAKGMEPESLKKDFGDRIVFHGGIDMQHTLPFGTREEVMAEVQRYIQALAPGGGYIVAPAHHVQSDVPPANLVAIRDAIKEFGRYPI